jgi:AraC-like DNA-binding protein
MSPFGPRVVIMEPGKVAEALVMRDGPHAEKPAGIVAGQDCLLYLARGRGTARFGGQTEELHGGTLVVVPAGTFPICEMDDEHELYVLAIRDEISDPRALRGIGAPMVRALSPDTATVWHERMQRYADLAENGAFRPAHLHQLKHELQHLFWLHDGAGAHDTLHTLFHRIWDELDGPLTIGALARDAGYTANYLNDLTRVHTGRSVGRWVVDMRMMRARSYLESTDIPIADVGAACGYDDPAYFSRAFRRAHGVAPALWRVAARPQDARHPDVTMTMDDIKAMQRRAESPRTYSIAS